MDANDHLLKKREFANRYFDASIWNDIKYRDGDIVVASYAKAGTTLVQQIIAQLIFDQDDEVDVAAISPWIDSVYPDKKVKLDLIEAQTHRRFLKTHLPMDALIFSEKAKYIYVGRDGRDIVWSLFDHQNAARQDAQLLLDKEAGPSGRLRVATPPQSSITEFFDAWLDKDGFPFWPFWENLRSWWLARIVPNVLFVHYADLITDMAEQILRIAAFLEVPLSLDRLPRILHNCSLGHMRDHARRYVPHGAGLWKDDGKLFFNKGQNGRWIDILTPEANAKFEQHAMAELGVDCAKWMMSGRAGLKHVAFHCPQ
ncbi:MULTISPECIES: sulfotransferase domain-containing protein [Rhizobium/Agrobacterium group]|uniref:Sulfotransferase n=2 Tax=Rhizobium/Agrobacterium group TaxID=227290 RepID=B9K4R0_ALLAM|nr:MULTISPECIES: sulfotransferase domain-containing protein [Rhizobium/Agrobacterium group]ACM39858.1 sulfotransferase [Allorhizobium ampelinum S4]MCF1447973.1 sulfotransferase domain-containing protein [Allorhizobium ampelinum]MCF1495269.1 sulfotransferase domain-containing protein [Allorhizobium ampelinum]MUO28653.1 sulfotransferase domain-containing protein [Agrobacterium vitis]MUO41554.1 sulfotransferase domain-containing protein [Agrobacterium vitis]